MTKMLMGDTFYGSKMLIKGDNGYALPIEVKSGNTRASSLKSLMKNHKDICFGYKFVDGNTGMSKDGIITLPLYMIAFI